MADPLSIAAGVTGILTAAAQISSVLIKFTKSVKDAPQQARIVIAEVSETSGILSQLQSFLVGSEFSDQSRSSMLKVDQLVTIISGCVLTFSELEKLLDEMHVQHMRIPDRFKWIRREASITDLIHRLQNHKASLSLMLNIFNGCTIVEAKSSVDRLYALVETCYDDISSRLNALETKLPQLAESAFTVEAEDDTTSILTAIPGPSNYDGTLASNSDTRTRNFTEVLQKSRVYMRNKAFRSSVFSHSTTDARSTRWSCLSGLSMAQVSNFSVLNLALTVNEVYNPWRSPQTWSSEDVSPAPIPQRSTVALQSHEPTQHDQLSYPSEDCDYMVEDDKATRIGILALLPSSNSKSTSCTNCLSACDVCGKKIEDDVIVAGTLAFCEGCFTCRNCKQHIHKLKFSRTSQGLSCSRCHIFLTETREREKMFVGIPKSYADWPKECTQCNPTRPE